MKHHSDDALSSAGCPNCHAQIPIPTNPVPPLTASKESDLDRMRAKVEPGDKNGAFNACPECGGLWADNAKALKEVARDEPSPDAKEGRNERGSKRKSGIAAD